MRRSFYQKFTEGLNAIGISCIYYSHQYNIQRDGTKFGYLGH